MKKEKNKKMYIGIIAGIVALLVLMMPVCYVRSVEVYHNNYYKTDEIVSTSGLADKHFLDLSFFTARHRLLKLPYISNVRIKYDFPGKIKIYVSEKAPFAYVQFKGTYLCVNEQGQVIEQTQKVYHDIPVIDGLDFEYFKSNETLPVTNQENWLTAQQIIKNLTKYNYVAQISKIDVHNIQEIHLYVDKLDVIMGDIGDFDKKIEALIATREKGFSMGRLYLNVINTKLNKAYLEPIT